MPQLQKRRIILCCDMSAFYASVEQAHNPSLRGKPVAIFGNPRKGFVITASYEARELGIHTLMYIDQAKKLCPDLIVKTPNFDLYRQESQRIFAFLATITPIMEQASIDEGYLELTEEAMAEHGGALEVAAYIQRHLRERMGLLCSIGISYNKYLAKFGSELHKPDGITVIRRKDIATLLWPRDVRQAHGVGSKTAELLQEAGYQTIGEVAQAPKEHLKLLLGNRGVQLWERVNGIDYRKVDPETSDKVRTLSAYTTLQQDSDEEQLLLDTLFHICQQMNERLQKRKLLTQNVHITIRYTGWQTFTRSRKLEQPIVETKDLFHAAALLWKKHWNGDSVRLIGITVSDIIEQQLAYKQLSLFTYREEELKIAESSGREEYDD